MEGGRVSVLQEPVAMRGLTSEGEGQEGGESGEGKRGVW